MKSHLSLTYLIAAIIGVALLEFGCGGGTQGAAASPISVGSVLGYNDFYKGESLKFALLPNIDEYKSVLTKYEWKSNESQATAFTVVKNVNSNINCTDDGTGNKTVIPANVSPLCCSVSDADIPTIICTANANGKASVVIYWPGEIGESERYLPYESASYTVLPPALRIAKGTGNNTDICSTYSSSSSPLSAAVDDRIEFHTTATDGTLTRGVSNLTWQCLDSNGAAASCGTLPGASCAITDTSCSATTVFFSAAGTYHVVVSDPATGGASPCTVYIQVADSTPAPPPSAEPTAINADFYISSVSGGGGGSIANNCISSTTCVVSGVTDFATVRVTFTAQNVSGGGATPSYKYSWDVKNNGYGGAVTADFYEAIDYSDFGVFPFAIRLKVTDSSDSSADPEIVEKTLNIYYMPPS